MTRRLSLLFLGLFEKNLLQSATNRILHKCQKHYCKIRKKNVTNCDRYYYKVIYYKVCHVLQSVKRSYYKVWQVIKSMSYNKMKRNSFNVQLFKSHLTHRLQRTKVNTNFISWTKLLLGVLQGSILGPLLINIILKIYFIQRI